MEQAARADRQEQTDSSESKDEAEKAAGQREREAFGQQLADDLEATSAERGAESPVLAFLTEARTSKKIRDVSAGDEKHEAEPRRAEPAAAAAYRR